MWQVSPSLCWYPEISSSNVLALQKALNKIPGSDTLTEDGVYGEKTSGAYNFLINELLHGSFPILTYVDPLQSAHTGIHVKPKITKQGQTYSQMFANGTNWRKHYWKLEWRCYSGKGRGIRWSDDWKCNFPRSGYISWRCCG